MPDTATDDDRPRLDGLRGRELLRVVRGRSLVLLGLSGLAVTQPLLDLFGSNPEFFVAGNYSRLQIVWFALVIAAVPPLVGTALVAVSAMIDRRAGTVVFAGSVAVLAAVFALAVLRMLGIEVIVVVGLLAAAFGLAVCVGILRATGVRLLVSYMAAANLLFVAIFLFGSPTSRLVAGDRSAVGIGDVTVPPLQAPVVLIVLDEFPAATIMRADGTLNDERYPNLARLADTSSWFRNASSTHNLTPQAVPSIFTGKKVDEGEMPTYFDHPRSLFALLGRDHPVHRYESVSDICPPTVCQRQAQEPLRQALDDAAVVYGHRVLPATFRDGLPAIDNSWGAYGADGTGEPGDEILEAYDVWHSRSADEQSPLGQAGVFSERVEQISGDPALHVIHVALPHRPWTLSRTGMSTLHSPEPPDHPDDEERDDYAFRARMEYQLHSMQVGATDALVGELLDQLESLPNWDDTLLVVTSDHGSNLTPPDLGRMRITDDNREEAYRVPLFIKEPGQVAGDGEVRDDPAVTIDVVPSVVDLLGIELNDEWQFDGHSLYDGSSSEFESLVSPDVDEAIAIAERRSEEFPHGDGWLGLAAVGEHGDLVGERVGDLPNGAPSPYRVTFDDAEHFDDLPTDDARMPFVLRGTVTPTDGSGGEPPELLAAVNGRLAGVVGGYLADGDGWSFVGYVDDAYEHGSNDVELYEVRRETGRATLHPVR